MNVTQLFSEKQILEIVDGLAKRIHQDYDGKNPHLVGCLTGSFVFMADLVRRLGIPISCDFMKVSSYEDRMSAGEIRLLLDATLPVKDRHVIIVEDIVDTGQSLTFIKKRLEAMQPASLETCVLLYKESPRIMLPKNSIKYLGLTVPDVFIVGYGIDCAQKFRELPYVGFVTGD
jgi:hypoxanthine phosphoribosyltransferase